MASAFSSFSMDDSTQKATSTFSATASCHPSTYFKENNSSSFSKTTHRAINQKQCLAGSRKATSRLCLGRPTALISTASRIFGPGSIECSRRKLFAMFEQLSLAITRHLNNVPLEITQNLVDSMPTRLKECLEAKGGSTRY